MNPFGWMMLLVPLTFTVTAALGDVSTAVWLYLGFNAVLNLPHQYGTWRRLYIEQRITRWWVLVAGLVFAGLAVVAFMAPPALRDTVLSDGFLYWGLHHLAVQHVGISRILSRRDGAIMRPRWQDRTYFLALLGLTGLWVHATTAMNYTIFGTTVQLHRLPIDPGAVPMVEALTLVAVMALVAWRLAGIPRVDWRTSTALRFDFAVVIASVIALASPYLLVTVAGLTAIHNIQYIRLVRQQQYARGTPLRRLDLLWAGLYVVVVHAVFFLFAAYGALMFAVLVAWHYLADARIWRPSRDRVLAHELRAPV